MATEQKVQIDPDNSAGTDYTSMDAMEDAWAGVAGNGDCVGEDVYVRAWCRCTGGTADSGVVDFTGWASVDVDHDIVVDVEEDYRHSGFWVTSGNVYRGDRTGGNDGIQVRMNYVTLRHLCERHRGLDFKGAITVRVAADEVYIEDCVVHHTSPTAENRYGIYIHSITSGSKTYLKNCLVYGLAGAGCKGFYFTTNTNYSIYMRFCSSINNLVGFNSGGSTQNTFAINCFTYDTTTAWEDNRWGDSSYNCYDNGSGIGSDPIDVSGMAGTDLFLDYASADYRIQAGSPIFRLGVDVSTDSDYAVSTDFEGNNRDALPTPHFDEYPAPLDPGPTAREQLQDHVSRWALDSVRRLNTYHPTS